MDAREPQRQEKGRVLQEGNNVIAHHHQATALVVIEDLNAGMATKSVSRDIDLIQLLLERIHHQLVNRKCQGVVIVSQPSGDRSTESKFLAGCVETLKCGTDYVKPDRIALSVLTSSSRFIRLLQLADVITSCSTAYVGGESRFSPPVFKEIKQIFPKESGRISGVGLKLHPDLKYANLYHWLVGDDIFWKHSTGLPLPWPEIPYNTAPDVE